jgi:hypothetical protein
MYIDFASEKSDSRFMLIYAVTHSKTYLPTSIKIDAESYYYSVCETLNKNKV